MDFVHRRPIATGLRYVLLATLSADTRCTSGLDQDFPERIQGQRRNRDENANDSMGTMANELTSIKQRLQVLLDRQARLDHWYTAPRDPCCLYHYLD